MKTPKIKIETFATVLRNNLTREKFMCFVSFFRPLKTQLD